jgi:hypothetical protein
MPAGAAIPAGAVASSGQSNPSRTHYVIDPAELDAAAARWREQLSELCEQRTRAQRTRAVARRQGKLSELDAAIDEAATALAYVAAARAELTDAGDDR